MGFLCPKFHPLSMKETWKKLIKSGLYILITCAPRMTFINNINKLIDSLSHTNYSLGQQHPQLNIFTDTTPVAVSPENLNNLL